MHRAFKLALASLAVLVLSTGAAQADTLTYSGDTFLNPAGSFNRPVDSGESLSVLATDVAYSTFQFNVSMGGSYTFLSTSQEEFIFDPFLALYSGAFDPASGLTNFVAANDNLGDDISDLLRSGFTANLFSGTSYFLVTTGHSNLDSGAFVNVIDGPGTIMAGPAAAPIPEPATMVLLGTGLASISAALRRRRKAS